MINIETNFKFVSFFMFNIVDYEQIQVNFVILAV